MSKDSPLVLDRARSSSLGPAKPQRLTAAVPKVEVGAPCLRCKGGCEGLLLHVWRKVCINCQCPRETHQASVSPRSSRISDRRNSQDVADEKVLNSYSWFPSGISVDLVKRYMECLPKDRAPLRGSEGEKKRNQLYLEQLPPHDLDPALCHDMSDIEKKRLIKIADKNKARACSVGGISIATGKKVCTQCDKRIDTGSVYITAARSPSKAWHPLCFTCTTCNEMLVDLIYFFNDKDESLYCGRHYAELKVPRCHGCDELIVADTFTIAEDKKWHKEHFCCQLCDTPLQGQKYAGRKDGSFVCQTCYDKTAVDCRRCLLPIKIGQSKITKHGIELHKDCFNCKRCRESLFDRDYFFSEGDFLCDECLQPVAQCSSCKEGIFISEKHMKHEAQAWHVKCFSCSSCKMSLIDKEFQNYAGNLVCVDCFRKKTSKKCNVCYKPITGKGVQFSFNVFHLECFKCADCNKALSTDAGKISEKHGKFYCESCVVKFAKICGACKEPVTSRHTMYKKKIYHLNCFKCTSCGIPIGTQSFYETSLNDILCEPCAGKNSSI